MIFAFVEDGSVEVVAGPGEAARGYEGIDVESDVYEFFDEDGCRLEPRFSKPNRGGRFLRLFRWAESGEFELVRSADAGPEEFDAQLRGSSVLKPNPWFRSLAELRRHVEGRRRPPPDASR